jgi:hypothetical protein
MLRKHGRRSVLIAALAVVTAVPLAVRAALPMVQLMLGDEVTVTCPTRLISSVTGDEMVLTCLPAGSALYRIVVPVVQRF